MATKKQQRRREKTRRHDGVWVDPMTGEELSEEEAKARIERARPERPKPAAAQAQRSGRGGGRGGATTRSGKAIQPPSWPRVGKRALIFTPIMFLLVMVTSRGDNRVPTAVITTAIMMAIFLPFSYLMDSLLYRQWQKRQAKGKEEAGRRR